jgi:putative alpha-1,2-mannosidase
VLGMLFVIREIGKLARCKFINSLTRHVFPGATLPFGIAKPGPDMTGNDNQAGYNPDGLIKGFSQLHSDGVSIIGSRKSHCKQI